MPDTLLAGGAISFRGALGFSVLRFGQFLVRFFGFGFRFFSTIMVVFRIFQPIAFYDFSVFSKEITPCGRANTMFTTMQCYDRQHEASPTKSFAQETFAEPRAL